MALCAAACLAVPAAAQAPPSSTAAPDSGFDEVQADLEGQLFTTTLPFDVPFIIYGTVPTGAKRLEIRCWKLDSSEQGGKRARRSGEPVQADAAKLAEQAPDGNCWAGGPLVWNNTIDPAAKTPSFRVLAPRLEAESYYTFEFRYQKEITPEEATAFAQKVQEILSRILWGDPRSNPQISSPEELPLSGSLFEPELEALYGELRAALKEITGADRIVESGTLFSADTPLPAAVRILNLALRPAREDQRKIVGAITDYRDDVANVDSRLAQVRGNGDLIKLGQALTSRAAADASVQHHAQTVSAALALADLPVLQGTDRRSPETLAEFVAKSAPVAADAAAKLAALADLLGKKLTAADGSPAPFLQPLLDSGALTTADVAALRKLGDVNSPVSSAARLADAAADDDLARLQRLLDERTEAVAGLADRYRTQVVGKVVLAGSTTGSFATQSKNYISADTGLAYAPELDEFPTYAGTNIYFRPVNKAAALSQFGPFFSRESLGRRVSVTIGLTVQGVGDDGKTRKDLFNSQSLVLGVGARMTNSVRLTVGSLVFLKTDPNPLVNDDTVAVTPFLSLSFDIDVVPTLQGIGGLFKTGTP
ncbi:MAG TPA: hypothetical protein VIC28_03100 [Thermoanaerobaculia bacterium]